ncbi:DNA cytosine methyltransferase [Planctomicrobium piriforme]|nr:DNA cytosine methyltransferase [Planctomicrobium piriforme]
MTTFVDLFCGAGGLSLGLQQAGWRPLLAVDHWADAIATYQTNFPDHLALQEELQSLDKRKLQGLLSQSPDWVVGGPPCQGFSTVGRRRKSDPRNLLVNEFARIVDILQPKGILVENVVGLRDMDFVGSITELFQSLGYSVTSLVLRAADYGVPQLRHRIFFVGNRKGWQFVLPKPQLSPENYVTVWDAIGDLPELGPGEFATKYSKSPKTPFQFRMRSGSTVLTSHVASRHPSHLVKAISHIPDGGNRKHIPPHLQPASGFHNSYSRLNSRAPAVAVTQNMGKPSGTRCIHPFQDRGLTAREGARLQGFPDTFRFSKGVTGQRLQIANAVSPILAELIGSALDDRGSWKKTKPAFAKSLRQLCLIDSDG